MIGMAWRERSSAVTAMAIVAATLTVIAWSVAGTNFLNCDMECGETLLAQQAVHQYVARGAEFALLENLGTSAAPQIYTHNVNIGSLSFVGLEVLGVPGKWKLMLPLVAFGVGLFYVYLTVRRAGNSDHAALITLVLFATTYWTIGAYALNALRAWHLLAFFAVTFHTLGLMRPRQSPGDVAGLLLGTLVAFGCGYDFWIICGGVSVALIVANAKDLPWRSVAARVLTIGSLFALPFLLRQVHVAYAMGVAYWAQDFIYSVAIKVPYASEIITIPSIEEIDAYYRTQHVLRPPAYPVSSILAIIFTLRFMISSVTVPRWGWLALVILVAVFLTAFVKPFRSRWLGTYSARLIVPATVGAGIGVLFLAPFSLHVYFKHEFPLVGFLLRLAAGALVYALARLALASSSLRNRGLAWAALAVFFIDTVMVHWNNEVHGPAHNFGWTEVYTRYPNENVALSVYDHLPTVNDYIGVDRARTAYVKADDVLSDRLKPPLWVYQPTQRYVDYDSPYPRCEWTGWLRALLGWHPKPKPGISCIYRGPLSATAVLQPSLDDVVERAKSYDVVGRGDRGIGYVILRRRS